IEQALAAVAAPSLGVVGGLARLGRLGRFGQLGCFGLALGQLRVPHRAVLAHAAGDRKSYNARHMRWLLVLVVACSSGSTAPPSRGPAWTPLLATQIRGWAEHCAIKPEGQTEVWTCNGLGTGAKVVLDTARHVAQLDLTLRSIMTDD